MPDKEIRDLKDGEWFWVDKAIIQEFTPRIGATGIAMYCALASFANAKTQSCFPTQKALADMLGLSRRTVARKIKHLKELRLINIRRIKGNNLYHLLNPHMTLKTQVSDSHGTSHMTAGDTNKNNRIRINNNDIDIKKTLESDFSFKGKKPQTREELLARDLAEALHDHAGFQFYLSLAREYPEALLRRILGEVKEIPSEKIKKSRGALFNYLIQLYAKKTSHYTGD